jgi:Putative Ig domain
LRRVTLSLTGTLSGTATALGTYRFAITVADSTAQTATTSYAITVADPLTITTAGPLSATLASPNTFTLAAAGGTQPYAWSLTTGTLPTGLTFAPNGVISGTPSAASTTTITVSVHDSAQPPATAAVSLTITAAGKLAISTTTLPAGNLTSPYNTPLQASGGASPYTWSLASGSLPPGLILVADGLLAGTATRTGPYTFAVTVADSSGQQASATFTCSIATIAITTSTLPTGTSGTSYIATTDAIGGLPPYSWSTPSLMPVGLIFTADGVITGTPTGPFTGSITFTATDQANATASRTLSLTITAPDAGTLTLTGLTAQLAPATQATLVAALAKAAPTDLTGRLTIQFLPDTTGRDDSTLVFVPANLRTISFSISKGSTTARFALAPTLQAGTSAGLITITATVDNSPSSIVTASTRVVALAPVITAAHIIAHDAYTLTLQLDGYSTTASVANAHFSFTGLATESDFNVTAIFNAWYSSQAANNQGGNFQYKQTFNFTGDTTNLSSLNATLTNSIGPSAPYTIPVTK